MNPGGTDAATIIEATAASTIQASAERRWLTDPLALLASVARAAEQCEPPGYLAWTQDPKPSTDPLASASQSGNRLFRLLGAAGHRWRY